jgi:hypothetical protein
MKKNRGDEPIWAITYMWKCHKETPCVAILKDAKNVIFFSSTKSENRRVKQVLPGLGVGCGGELAGTSGKREVVGKRCERVNTV